jgi:XRE family transcriptional regulator, regulator of sulfur utilization
MTTVGKSLRRLRTARGWTQRRLSEKSGVSYVVVTKVEQGLTKDPAMSTLVKLADALGVSLDKLVGR